MARISLVHPLDADEEVRALFGELEERFQKVPNLFAAIANHPPAMGPILGLFEAVYAQDGLSDRLKELVLVKVAFGLQSHYCLTLHKAFALERGVSNEELKALREEDDFRSFPEAERVVLRYADAYVEDARQIPDRLYDELRSHYAEGAIVRISLLVSLALLFGDLANALHIPIDAYIGPPKA